MALVDDVARACASTPLVARWAPQIAAAAAKHACELISADDLALDIAALIWRETRGKNVVGDDGHGHGLGQVDDRSHEPWLEGHADGMDPDSNVDETAEIYVTGLRAIAAAELARGAQHSPEELRRIAMAAYNHGAPGELHDIKLGADHVDDHTTGHNYAEDTWRQREVYAAALGGTGVCA